jgi:threonine/homoserine/homoserine lactone efflux protein
MSPQQALFFGLTCLGFGFIPGPALLQTVSLTLQHGRRAGFLSALGIHLGAFFQICIVALGAVAVTRVSPGGQVLRIGQFLAGTLFILPGVIAIVGD